MKYVIFLMSILFSIHASAQETYDATLTFPMTDSTDEAGSIYKRKGFFEGMQYNQNAESLEVKVRVKFYNNVTELKRLIQSYVRFFTIDNSKFVISATGIVVGDREQMRALYGVVQTPATDTTQTVWRQSVLGGDSLTTPCMGKYTYYTKQFDINNKLHLLIKNLAVIAAGEGKLN